MSFPWARSCTSSDIKQKRRLWIIDGFDGAPALSANPYSQSRASGSPGSCGPWHWLADFPELYRETISPARPLSLGTLGSAGRENSGLNQLGISGRGAQGPVQGLALRPVGGR